MEPLLQAVLNPDNDTRKAAEANLQASATSHPDAFLSSLLGIMVSHGEFSLRQMAAIVLRRNLASLWKAASPPSQASFKQIVLESLSREQHDQVANAIAVLTSQAAISILNSEPGGWPELLPYLQACITQGAPKLKAAAFSIFSELCTILANMFRPYFLQLAAVINANMAKSQPFAVRLAAAKAAEAIISYSDKGDAKKALKPLANDILQLLDDLRTDNEDLLLELLSVIDDIISFSPGFFSNHFPQLLQLLLAIASDDGSEESVQNAACIALLSLAEKRSNLFPASSQVTTSFYNLILRRMYEGLDENPQWESTFDNDEELLGSVFTTYVEFNTRLTDVVSCREAFPQLAGTFQTLFGSSDWKQKHVACTAMLSMADAGINIILKTMPALLQAICSLCSDAHSRVRWAAVSALGILLSQAPVIMRHYHANILPILLQTMSDASFRVRARGAQALINSTDTCEFEHMAPFLHPALESLNTLLCTGPEGVYESCLQATCAVAALSEKEFIPFYPSFMHSFKAVLVACTGQSEPRKQSLGGVAVETISKIAEAVGAASFKPDLHEIMQLIVTFKGHLGNDDVVSREISESITRIAVVCQADFAPYLQYVVPSLLAAADVEVTVTIGDKDDDTSVAEARGAHSVVLPIEGQGRRKITINTSEIEDKSQACEALTDIIEACSDHFRPFAADTARVMLKNLGASLCNGARLFAASSCPPLLKALSPEHRSSFWEEVKKRLNERLQKEGDAEVLSEMLKSYGSCISILGQAAFSNPVTDIPGVIQLCFKCVQDSAKQIVDYDANNAADDDEDREELWPLIEDTDEIFDGFRLLIDALMMTYKEPVVAFVQALVLPTLGEFLSKPLFGPEIKSTTMNLMNALVKFGGASGSGLVPVISPIWLAACQEEDADVRVTAFYGIGIFAMSNPGFINQGLASIWQCLEVVLGKKSEMIAESDAHIVWDNALAAAFRLFRCGLLTDPSIYNGLLGLLPIESDIDEAAAVVDFVVEMSDRFRPPAGLRSLAERQVKLLADKHENFQQVQAQCNQFLSLYA